MPSGGWQWVESTAIEAVRYLPERGVLEVVFNDGESVYDYPCTDTLYAGFVAAGSKGTFVNTVLKPYAETRGWTPRPRPWVPGSRP